MNKQELQESLTKVKVPRKPRDIFTHPYTELETKSRDINSHVRSIHGCMAQLVNIAHTYNIKLKRRVLLPADMPLAEILSALKEQYLAAVLEARVKLREKYPPKQYIHKREPK